MSAFPFMPFLGGEKKEEEDFFKNEVAKWLEGLNPAMGIQAMPQNPPPAPEFMPPSPPQAMLPRQMQQPVGLKDFIRQYQEIMPPRPEPMNPILPLAMGLMGLGQQMRTPPRYRTDQNPMGTALMQYMLLQQKQAEKPREEIMEIGKLWPAYARAGDLDKRLLMQENLADKRADLQRELEDLKFKRYQGLQTQRDEAMEKRLEMRLEQMGGKGAEAETEIIDPITGETKRIVTGRKVVKAGLPRAEKEIHPLEKALIDRMSSKTGKGAMPVMPDPKGNAGRTIRDTTTGKRYRSNGVTWEPIK